MSWHDQLQPASFRGVPFLVDGDSMSGGRRGPTHEYPYKDEPDNEDMGLKARQYKFNAYVIGFDYMGKRDALIAALEAKGAGVLIHPQYGSANVQLKSYSVKHQTDKSGEALFDLNFAQEDAVTHPKTSSNTLAKINTTQVKSNQQIGGEFDNNMAQWI